MARFHGFLRIYHIDHGPWSAFSGGINFELRFCERI